MFKICLAITRFNLTKIQGCLKVLKIDSPTSKKQIKLKYLQLAKQLHPDVKEDNGASISPEKIQKRNEAFIEITKAYKYLNELSEKQINNPSTQESEQYFGSNTDQSSAQNSKRQSQKPLTPQERTRRETYAYFNKKYRRQSYQSQQRKKQPLYKQIPEFFLGCCFVAAFLIEWAYMAIKRSTANIQKDKSEDISQIAQGFSFKKKYQKNIQ